MKLLLCATATLPAFVLSAHAQEVADDEIVVTGQRAQQERAIEIKRDAIGIIDVAAADEIGRLPDRNVAEVVERLPGVGVTYDQGEGRYVAIRGIPSDLNNYTFGGVEIGNPDGQNRSLPLDIVSGQLLNRVEVSKAKTANQDGQGIGGSINLVPQTAFDFRDRFILQANGQVGYQELNEKVPVRGDVSVGARFGADEEFGVLIGGSYSERTFASYGVYPDDWRPVSGAARGGMPINIKYTDYSLKRERIGAAGSLDWRSGDHELYLRGIYSKFTEDEYRQRYRLDFATDALIASPAFSFAAGGNSGTVTGTPNVGVGGGSGPERRQDLRLEYKEKSILAGMLGGSSRFRDVKVDYVVARVHNEVREPNQLWQFRCNPGTVDFNFAERVFTATPRTECAASQLNFRQYAEQFETGDEDIWQGKADLTWTIPGMEDSFVAAGGKFRLTDKSFDSRNDSWTRGGNATTRFTLGQFNLAGPTVLVYPDGDDRPYANGPTIDAAAITAWTAANLTGPYFVRDNAATLANATLNDIFIEEDVWAGYAMASLKFGPLTITPGLRYERTTSTVTGSRLQNGTTIVPVQERNQYSDWLPSVIIRMDAGDKFSFRMAYTRNLGRPNYSQLSPGGALSYEDGNGNGTFEGSFSTGNPDLLPYRADSLDLSAEYYFAKGGLISLGAFVKYIDNPIFTQNYTLTNTSFAGLNFERLSFSQPQNADKAELIGVEAAFQMQFTFLPGFLSGFGFEANGTLVSSSLTLPNGRVSTFPSQSEFLYGAQLFYQAGPVEASVAYHNTGASLIAVGGLAYQDQYNDDLRRLDAKVKLQITKNMAVFAEAQNLTDEPTRQYQGDRTDWFVQNERYGRTFWAGASAKF
ncbi:TonB-dependent receptor [Sphingomonas sp.]